MAAELVRYSEFGSRYSVLVEHPTANLASEGAV